MKIWKSTYQVTHNSSSKANIVVNWYLFSAFTHTHYQVESLVKINP